MILIVGSGPTGTTAADFLLKAGHRVTMIDVGIRPDQNVIEFSEKLRLQDQKLWSPELRTTATASTAVSQSGQGKKLYFGSDFAYRQLKERPIKCINTGAIEPSFAQGGFSNVWGAAAMPYSDDDIADWPVRGEDLHEGYREVANRIRLHRSHESIDGSFADYGTARAFEASIEVSYLQTKLQKTKEALKRQGIHFGGPRLAVNLSACTRCGLCMCGCPYGLIYSSRDSLDKLRKHPNLTYHSGYLAEKFSESNGGVSLIAKDLKSGELRTWSGQRLLVAAGVINSTFLMANSLELFDRDISIKTSDYFLAPWLTAAFRGVSSQSERTSLAELFMEIRNNQIDDHWIHLQIYGYMDLYRQTIANMIPLPQFMASPLAKFLARRMLAVQGYLHSDASAKIQFNLHTNREVTLTGIESSAGLQKIKDTVRLLNRQSFRTGHYLPWALARVGKPGEGRHIGGTFPMAKNSDRPGVTDILGRLHKSSRVHLIDASILPSIAAPTITFVAMANAWRISQQIHHHFRSV